MKSKKIIKSLSETKVSSEVDCIIKKPIVIVANKSDARASDIGASSTNGIVPRKQFFQMLAPEDELNSDSGDECLFKKSELTITEPYHFLAEPTVPKIPYVSSEKRLDSSPAPLVFQISLDPFYFPPHQRQQLPWRYNFL
ncbi:hypothetical protein ZOSMA_264G00280 [Zostera marina]|uniref:Uncharacterized protein n=1 Tax=Zostera marina TaxID=29655 RepID=A0A0K9PF00_ZOSMR|nr:hypothetical protein ZOSMA_264G00280 [Zostera marina]